MAHMIEENQIAYAGETPWHGLGVEVVRGTTGAEMLAAAGLDWKIEKRRIAVADGRKFATAPVQGYTAITRSDSGRVFQIATPKYQPVQNKQIVDFFAEYCAAGHATMETVGALRGGAVVWALARLSGATKQINGSADEVRGYMLLSTSHDATLCTSGRPTQVRVVCNNTLTAAMYGKADNSFRVLHNTKWTAERREAAQKVMGIALEQITKTNTLAEQLAKVTIDEKGWLDFMGELMGGEELVIDPKKAQLTRTARMIQESTVNSPGSDMVTAKGTLWGAVNGVTHYADHRRGFKTTTNDSRMAAAWFGEGERMKTKALEVAAEMAGLTLAAV